MTNSIKLNKDVKKYLKKLYMKGSFNDVKIKDKESDSLSWNNLSITFKFKNGVLLNFWLKGNNLKYTIFSVLQPISACKECEMYNFKATELNIVDIAPIYDDIVKKIDKLFEYIWAISTLFNSVAFKLYISHSLQAEIGSKTLKIVYFKLLPFNQKFNKTPFLNLKVMLKLFQLKLSLSLSFIFTSLKLLFI